MGKIARTHGGSLCAASSPCIFHGSGPLVDYFTATKLENLHCCQLYFALIVAGIFAWRSFDGYMTQLYTYRQFTKNEAVIEYIRETTSPDEQVLLWGAETSINYFAQRKSPTRFVYQSPLHQENYTDETMIDQFLEEVIQNQPRLIIETDTKDALYSFPLSTETIEKKTSFLKARYCIVQRMDSWKIYEYTKGGCSP